MARRTGDQGDGGPERLKRERAGSYRTEDGRFAVEEAGSGWMILDAEQADDLGLPLVRGPFATLDEVRDAIAAARRDPQPERGRPGVRLAAMPDVPKPRHSSTAGAARKAKVARAATPPVIIRELRIADGPSLRSLWAEAGFRALGDDDLSLARLAKRNPGLVLVATEGRRIVGSALGAWDGRRGWIYHVATAPSHRRRGIAARLVRQVEDGLRAMGCPKVNVIVHEENDEGRAFWAEVGYEPAAAQQFDKALKPD